MQKARMISGPFCLRFYTSPTTKIVTGTKVMTNTFYTKPRRVAQITGPSSCP